MRTPSRALSVEPVEDRSVPSAAFVLVEPGLGHHYGFGQQGYAAASNYSAAAYVSRGWEARTFQAETLVRVRFADDSILFIRETPTGFQLIPVTVTYTPPTPVVDGPSGDGGSSGSGGGSAQGGNTGTGPVVASRGPVRVANAAGTTPAGAGDVAVVVANEAAAGARPTATADQQAAAAAAQVSVQNVPPAVVQATQTTSGHAAYAITAIVPEADGADVAPPADPAPMPGPAPKADPGSDGGIVELAVNLAAPVAGLVPLDLAALSVGAGQFLGRVADLAPAWPDSMPGFSDSLWVAAGTLLTGGVAFAATNRSAPKPARDPLAGALSEWERRHGRVAG